MGVHKILEKEREQYTSVKQQQQQKQLNTNTQKMKNIIINNKNNNNNKQPVEDDTHKGSLLYQQAEQSPVLWSSPEGESAHWSNCCVVGNLAWVAGAGIRIMATRFP